MKNSILFLFLFILFLITPLQVNADFNALLPLITVLDDSFDKLICESGDYGVGPTTLLNFDDCFGSGGLGDGALWQQAFTTNGLSNHVFAVLFTNDQGSKVYYLSDLGNVQGGISPVSGSQILNFVLDEDEFQINSSGPFNLELWGALDLVDFNSYFLDFFNQSGLFDTQEFYDNGFNAGKNSVIVDSVNVQEVNTRIQTILSNGQTFNNSSVYSEIYQIALDSTESDALAIQRFIPAVFATFFAFFFQIMSINVLGFSLLSFFALLLSIWVLIIFYRMVIK
jgi:hypothetical protein